MPLSDIASYVSSMTSLGFQTEFFSAQYNKGGGCDGNGRRLVYLHGAVSHVCLKHVQTLKLHISCGDVSKSLSCL